MNDGYSTTNRRNFLRGATAVVAVGLAGCTSDGADSPENSPTSGNDADENTPPTETSTEENVTPEEDRVTFEELYSEAERKPITGETASQNTGPITVSEIESMLEPENSEVENVVLAATQASQHTLRREDTPYTIRYVLSKLDLNAFAQERRTGAGAKTDIYVDNGSRVKKVAVTKVPHNTDIPLQYSLIGGEEPGTGDGAKADNNLASDWNENHTATGSYLDFRGIKNIYERDSVSDSDVDWVGLSTAIKRSYLLDGGVKDSDIGFTLDAGLDMAELEDIDQEYHGEAFEAYADTNEFYHAEVVPEDQHLLVELNAGELQPRAVDEETLREEGFIYSHL